MIAQFPTTIISESKMVKLKFGQDFKKRTHLQTNRLNLQNFASINHKSKNQIFQRFKSKGF